MLHKALFSALLASVIGSCLLTGCATPFERFYKPAASANGSRVIPPATPLLVPSRDSEGAGEQLAREGYALVGSSYFITGQNDDSFYKDQAITQGMKVGAAVVLLQVDYTNVRADGCCARVSASYWAKSDLIPPRVAAARTPPANIELAGWWVAVQDGRKMFCSNMPLSGSHIAPGCLTETDFQQWLWTQVFDRVNFGNPPVPVVPN